ncbi:putative signal peptidase I [Lupinus albus]|uniref:Putative signal peptidase I n=1 Tax=Lupinus albus TaxID=3870 RepID=A0A6A4NH90_LUPAL|nr:putative signal peptidase I [Lupinus albus]
MTTMGVFCISLFKISSKWLHCNEYFPEPNWEVDKGGTHSFLEIDVDVGSKDFERSCCWVSRFLNICCEDAKVAFTDITVSFLFKSYLAEPRSIPYTPMNPTLTICLLSFSMSYFYFV